jgi:methylation protein EvaC
VSTLSPEDYKRSILKTLMWHKRRGHTVAAYGASAKFSTVTVYCGIGPDLVDYCVDSTPEKQHKFTPGRHIPVLPPAQLDSDPPDVIWITAPNWESEIVGKLKNHIDRGAVVYSGLKRIA